MDKVSFEKVLSANRRLEGIVRHTPLELLYRDPAGMEVYVKLENLQKTGSYKFRGAYNCIDRLSATDKENGVVCASTGNHALGVALSCNLLGVNGTVFMPKNTPYVKSGKTKLLGYSRVKVELRGDNFDEACEWAMDYAANEGKVFIHPFNDPTVIAGQGTVAVEVLQDLKDFDYIFVPVGGGGLMAGIVSYLSRFSKPKTHVFAVEPSGAAAMYESNKAGKVLTLNKVYDIVDAVAVKRPGDLAFEITRGRVEDYIVVNDIEVCYRLQELASNYGIMAEPAGALSVAGMFEKMWKRDLDFEGKKVVCLVTGGNLNIDRIDEIMDDAVIAQYQ